jgi:hypothetical protein
MSDPVASTATSFRCRRLSPGWPHLSFPSATEDPSSSLLAPTLHTCRTLFQSRHPAPTGETNAHINEMGISPNIRHVEATFEPLPYDQGAARL